MAYINLEGMIIYSESKGPIATVTFPYSGVRLLSTPHTDTVDSPEYNEDKQPIPLGRFLECVKALKDVGLGDGDEDKDKRDAEEDENKLVLPS